MEQSNSMENLHFLMSTGNVRNLARLFEGNSVSRKPNFTLSRSKSKSYSSVVITQEVKETQADASSLTFRDIHSKFESGKVKKSIQRMSSVNSLECLKLQEIKEISRKTDEIVTKVKGSEKVGSTFYIAHLNDIVEMLLQIGQIETNGNGAIQTEKLATLQVLQKCYSQLRGKLENFLVEDSGEEEEQKVSIRSCITKWESMIDPKAHYEVPNYSTYFASQRSEDRSQRKVITGEIVRCTDMEDDNKMVEHVKVQNLKDIWERRNSVDVQIEESQAKENEMNDVNVGSIAGIVKQFEETPEPPVQIIGEQLKPEAQQFDRQSESDDEPQIEEQIESQIEEQDDQQNVQEEVNESSLIEDMPKIIDDDLKFLEEERKHTTDTYNEEQLADNKVDVEYVAEPDYVGDLIQIEDETKPTLSSTNEVEYVQDLIQIEDVTSDGNVLSTNQEQITSTLEFLDQERKSSVVDPKSGLPVEMMIDDDDEFVGVHEKQDSDNETKSQRRNELRSKEESVQENANTDEFVINRSVEEVGQSTKKLDETVLVNGDKH